MGSDLNQSWVREQYLNERVRDLLALADEAETVLAALTDEAKS